MRPALMLVALVLGFAVGMAGLLNYFKFESTVKKLQRSRISLVAAEAHGAMEKSLALGAVLAESATLRGMLESLGRADALILSIDLLDANGAVALSTDAARVGSTPPQAWLKAARRPGTSESFVDERAAFAVVRIVRNSFDVPLGSVVVRYERTGFDRTVAAMGRNLGLVGLMALAGAAALSSLALFALFSRIGRELSAAERVLAQGAPANAAGGSALDREVLAFGAGIGAAGRAIVDVENALASAPMGSAR